MKVLVASKWFEIAITYFGCSLEIDLNKQVTVLSIFHKFSKIVLRK